MTFLASPVSSSSTPLTVWTTTFTLWMAATLSLARWWLLATTPAKKSTNPILRAKVTKKYGGDIVVFDGYKGTSTKDMTHQRWASKRKWANMSFMKTTQKGTRWLTCSLANCRRKNVSCPRCCWSPHSAERVLSSDCYHNKHCVHICLYSSSTLPTSSHMTSGIWNPSKSEVMGRCGGDEKNEWPRRTDKSRTVKKREESIR